MFVVKFYLRYLVGSFIFIGLGLVIWGCGSGSSSSKKSNPTVKIIVAGQKDNVMGSGCKWWIKGLKDNGLEDTNHWNKIFSEGKSLVLTIKNY